MKILEEEKIKYLSIILDDKEKERFFAIKMYMKNY